MKIITTHSKKSFIWNTLIIKKNKKVTVDFFMAHLKRRWRFWNGKRFFEKKDERGYEQCDLALGKHTCLLEGKEVYI